MRVEVHDSTAEQQSQTALNQPTPQKIARIIAEKTVRAKATDVRKNLESFRTRKNNTVTEQNTITHSYQNNRPLNNTSKPSDTYASPPMPKYPPPIRPSPLEDYTTNSHRLQQSVQQRWFERNSNHFKPNNLHFPYAVTAGSSNKKSFFHQWTNEQTPTSTVMDTIWFHDMDPTKLNNPHSSNYNPLLSYRNWAEMQFESKHYNFVMAPLHNLKDRISEYFPPSPSEITNTVKGSTKNMGRDKIHQSSYAILKQFYSWTERFLYDYDYDFKVPVVCMFDHLVAKASRDLSAYSVFGHELFQLSFNFLHPTTKDVQNNNYRVHEAKLIHNLFYYTIFRDTANYTDKSYIHINDQLTSPYFLNYGYKLKWEYTTGTLRNFDPIKNFYLFLPKEAPERPLIVPLE